MTVAEAPTYEMPNVEAAAAAAIEEAMADPASASLEDDLWPGLEADAPTPASLDEVEQVVEESASQEATPEGEEQPPSLGDEQPPDEWTKRFEDLQKWTNDVSSENGRLRQRLEALEKGQQEKTTQAEQDSVLAEIRDAVKTNPDIFTDPEALNEHVISATDRIVQARTKDAFDRLEQRAAELEKGAIYQSAIFGAGQHGPALQATIAQMAQHEMQTNNRNIFTEFTPQQVLRQAAQYLHTALQNNNPTPADATTPPQRTEAQPPSPQQAPPPQQTTPPRQTFTPEAPSVGLSSGAATAVTEGSYNDARGAVQAALRELEQG